MRARSLIKTRLRPVALAVHLAVGSLLLAGTAALPSIAHAQAGTSDNGPVAAGAEATLSTVVVQASADASAEGLTKPYAGGQVARGSRVGVLGNQDVMETPFSTTAYTSQLIQDQQAKSVADVVQNDPTVRVARGFGNFQELYVIRGFPVPSDDMTYNGLYGILPRQYVAAELLERVEIFRGASSFTNGGVGAVSGFGVGGTVNALPKRAPNEALTQIGTGIESGGHAYLAADVARRFGPDERLGLRINAAQRGGETAVDNEKRELGVFALGADYRGNGFRISADIGHQNHRIDAPRPSVTPNGGIPKAPDADSNFAQSWTFAKERSTFATARAEFDLGENTLAWVAAGLRNGDEENQLANPKANAAGITSAYRFDNVREDQVRTGEIGLRTRFDTGAVKHTVVVSAADYQLNSKNAWRASDWFANGFQGDVLGNLYQPGRGPKPAIVNRTGNYDDPLTTAKNQSNSVALADTLAFADDRIQLTLGARHQQMDNRSYDYNTGARVTRYDESELTPMAGLVVRLQPALALYANYIEGLTAGDSAPWNATNVGHVLAPSVVKQKEIGVKYDGGKFGGGVAVFSTDKPFGMLNPANLFVDGGEQRNQGVEFSLFGEAARGVRVLGGLTLLDAEITDSEDRTLVGKRAIGVPKTQANLGTEWDVPGVRGLTFSGRVVYTGSQYANAANTLSVPSWTRLDLGARYTTTVANQIVTFRARVDNVTNRDYWASVGGYPGESYLVLGAPRTFTLSATAEF